MFEEEINDWLNKELKSDQRFSNKEVTDDLVELQCSGGGNLIREV